jgi:chromosome segregation ATPase
MATSSPDDPPTATGMEMESEKSDYPASGPQKDCSNSDAGTNNSGNEELVDQQGVPSDLTTKTTKGKIHCTVTCVLFGIMFFALIMLAVIVGAYISLEFGHVNDRMDRLETECSSGCATLSTNKTQLNSGLESDDELSARISNLSAEIDGVKVSMSVLQSRIQMVQAIHENDMDQIRMNMSTMLTQINTSLIGSLQRFTDKAASNISELSRNVQRELSGVRNHSLMLAQNVSALIDQVSLLDKRSDELEMNATALESNITERLSRLMVNVSSNAELLREVSATQVRHSTTIEQMGRNISSAEDRFEQQLSDARDDLISMLSGLNSSLSQIDTSHRAYLGNLSSDLNDLSDELMATTELFSANASAMREELTELSENLDYTNDNLTDLSPAQKRLLLDLADIKEINSGNISAIGQSLVQLNEELEETSGRLENLSSIQDSLQHDLGLTNEAIRSNISALELKFNGEINRTQVQLQSQYRELWLNLVTMRDGLEANISTLQGNHGLLQEDLDHTKAKLQTLSSEHVDLQNDYNATIK